jgi:2-polyprenyl-3-methyl-5-hydroxy-6-metoxy-1,4-benzoquinol methylase
MEETVCALCGDSSQDILFVTQDTRFDSTPRNSFSLVACRTCGLRYLSPRPTRATLLQFYPAGYFAEKVAESAKAGTSADDEPSLFRRLRPSRRTRRLREKLDAIEALVRPEASILEIGPGDGDFLASLKVLGYEPLGIDVAPEAVNRLRSEVGVPAFLDVEAEGRIPDRSLDAVVLWNAFEHVPDPRRLLADITGWLRPGGCILMSLPNAAALERNLFFPGSPCEDIPRHLFSYTPETLTRLLQCHGLTGIRFRHHTLCATSELQERVEARFLGRTPSNLKRALYAVAILPLIGLLDRAFAASGRAHSFVVWARLPE